MGFLNEKLPLSAGFVDTKEAQARWLDAGREFARQEERNLLAMIERERRLGLDSKMSALKPRPFIKPG